MSKQFDILTGKQVIVKGELFYLALVIGVTDIPIGQPRGISSYQSKTLLEKDRTIVVLQDKCPDSISTLLHQLHHQLEILRPQPEPFIIGLLFEVSLKTSHGFFSRLSRIKSHFINNPVQSLRIHCHVSRNPKLFSTPDGNGERLFSKGKLFSSYQGISHIYWDGNFLFIASQLWCQG